MKSGQLYSNEIQTGKIICELVFNTPRIDFYDNLFRVAQEFTEDFSDWRTDRLTVHLKNIERGEHLLLKSKTWRIIAEYPSDYSEFINRASIILNKCLSLFSYDSISRLGLRTQTFRDNKMTFEEAVGLFHLRSHSSELHKIECFNDLVTDDSLVINTEKDKWKLHFEIGPTRKEETLNRCAFEFAHDKKKIEKIPNSSYWCDIDVATESCKPDDLSDNIIQASDIFFNAANDIYKFLKIEGRE